MTGRTTISRYRTLLTLLGSPLVLAFVFQARAPGLQQAGIPSGNGLNFDHVLHVEDVELLCDDCHSGVEASVSGLDDLLPDKDVCADCHEVDDDDECGTCHTNVDEAAALERITTYSEKFSHQRHLTNGLECNDCHAALLQPDMVEVEAIPTMVGCLDCHESQSVTQECSSCHLADAVLLPETHAGDFLHTHGIVARLDAHETLSRMQCQTCHEPSYCQDCHEGDNVDRTTHPLNYEFTHALDARNLQPNCYTCHADVTFCGDCHAENQVLPQTHRPGWAIPGDGGLHRFEASADLNSCISCHQDDAATTCGTSGCHDSQFEDD